MMRRPPLIDRVFYFMYEVWIEIKEFEGYYAVSNLGRVKRLSRINKRYDGKFFTTRERMLKPIVDKLGYLRVGLSKNGYVKQFKVHKLVAQEFMPISYKKGYVIDHIDNNPSNSKLDNLQLITHRENTSKDKKGHSSKYVGVVWSNWSKKWESHININGKKRYLGCFTDEETASKIYQLALINMNNHNGNNKEFIKYLKSLV